MHDGRPAARPPRPPCPYCEGRGVLFGDTHIGYGMMASGSAECERCRGRGHIAQCWDCDAPFAAGDELYENRSGEFVCARCAREPQGDAPSAPDTLPSLPPDPEDEEDAIVLQLAASLELVEDAREVGIAPSDAMALMRRRGARMAGGAR